MVQRTVRNWLVVLASLGLTTIGVLAAADHHVGPRPFRTTVGAQAQVLPSGVFGWD